MRRAFHVFMTLATALVAWHWVTPNQYLAMGAAACGFLALFCWMSADMEEP